MKKEISINNTPKRKPKIIKAANIPSSLSGFFKGMLKRMSEEYEVIALASPGAEMDVIREREGVRTEAIPIERRPSILKDIQSLCRLIAFFRKEKPDVVHSMSAKAGMLCMIAAKITHVPHRVHSFTGLAFPTATGLRRLILMTTERITCACGNHLLPEGEGVKKDLINNHITKKELRVIGHGNIRGIDLDYYDRTPEVEEAAMVWRKPDVFTFVFVGRLVRDKGVNELIEAMVDLHKKYGNTRLLLLGDYDDGKDPLKKETIDIIENSTFIENVGWQNDVRPYLVASDCFVMPSYREGFPNSVIEAGAMSLASIVTDINGANEIIIESENGIIIPSQNKEKLQLAMEYMFLHAEERFSMAQKARSLVAERYEIGYVQQCYLDFYREILNERS